jgi:hypothetical protein
MENEVFGLADIILSNSVWGAIAVFVMGYVAVNIVKSVATSIFQYIMLKTDQFGIGSVIEYKGKRYVIREIGFRRIALEEKTTREWYYIATNSWMHMILIVPVDASKPGD